VEHVRFENDSLVFNLESFSKFTVEISVTTEYVPGLYRNTPVGAIISLA